MLTAAGFAVAGRYGDLAGAPCTASAPRFVTVSRRIAR
jgi:hypothetical protein